MKLWGGRFEKKTAEDVDEFNSFIASIDDYLIKYENCIISEEDREKALKQFEEGLEFSIERINEYVLNLLEGKDNIIASNIKFYQENDYIRLILIPVYAFLSETDYKIELLNEKGYIDNIEFDNFIIQRRQRI